MRNHIGRSPVVVLLVSLLAVVVGCSSSGKQATETTKAVESFSSTRTSLDKGVAEIDKALASLDQLAAGGDLQKSFKSYSAAVEDVESAGKKAHDRAQSMRQRVEAYVTRWQAEIDQMQDPAIKEGLVQRREAVRANFDDVRAAVDEVREAYQPFLRHLQEIQRALALNLTPQTVAGLQPAFESAKSAGANLREKANALRSALDQVVAQTSPTPPKQSS